MINSYPESSPTPSHLPKPCMRKHLFQNNSCCFRNYTTEVSIKIWDYPPRRMCWRTFRNSHGPHKLPQCIGNALCHFTQYIQLYQVFIYHPIHNYMTCNSKISTITKISSLELNIISSPMAHTHDYIPYNWAIHNFISNGLYTQLYSI